MSENIPLNLKRNVMPTPAGIKTIYNFTDGTFLAEINIITAGQIAQQNVPNLLMDLAKALQEAMANAQNNAPATMPLRPPSMGPAPAAPEPEPAQELVKKQPIDPVNLL